MPHRTKIPYYWTITIENHTNITKFVALHSKIPPTPPVVCLVILQGKVILSVCAHFVVIGLVIINSNSAPLLWLPRDQWYRRYTLHNGSIKFWTFTLILKLKTANHFFFCMTLQLMMMHHNTKFVNKTFGGLEDICTNTGILSLCCDLDL